MEEKFYECTACGNLAFMLIASGVTPVCCGDDMQQIVPNTTDGDKEKHMPVVKFYGPHKLKVCIGSEPHPMSDKHHIVFVCLETSVGGVIRYLDKEQKPEVCFRFSGKPKAVYAYCNMHGLWRTPITGEPPTCDD